MDKSPRNPSLSMRPDLFMDEPSGASAYDEFWDSAGQPLKAGCVSYAEWLAPPALFHEPLIKPGGDVPKYLICPFYGWWVQRW